MNTVLIVEDDRYVLILSESILRAHGFNTLAADEAERAVPLLEKPGEPIDLLLTDIGFRNAKLGGLDLAQEAVRLRPGLPVLYVSGRDLTDSMRARFVPNSSFLPKPYTSDALLWSVRGLLSNPLRAGLVRNEDHASPRP